jgi:hypothetical protein
MSAYFELELDTVGPAGVAAVIDAGAAFTSDVDVSLGVTTTDPDTTGYQVKIWGDVDPAFNASIQPLEVNSAWITLASPHAVRISTGDGSKTLNVRIRDDVLNESAPASDSITLDTTVPVVSITSGPDRTVVSKQAGVNVATFSWQSDADYDAYEVRVVPATTSPRTAGTVIPTTAGSTNTSGSEGSAATPITSSINATDLETASPGDGDKVIKVFVQDPDTGNWSN